MADSKRSDTNFLRVLALALVLNSHMKLTYPRPFGILASGGMLGNALFFMLSSFGLAVSMQTTRRSFVDWYSRRIIRIYPSVWVVILLLTYPLAFYNHIITPDNFLDELEKFFYPPFWFLQALLFYYAAIYWIISDYSPRKLGAAAAVTLVGYATYYVCFLDLSHFSIEGTPFRLFFYFLVVLWGIFLGTKNARLKPGTIIDVAGCAVCLGAIYGDKYLLATGVGGPFQFVQHAATFPLLYFALRLAKTDLVHHLMESRFLGAALTFISGATLEAFMVNNTIDFLGPRLGAFPWNVLILLTLNIVVALVVFYLSKPMGRLIAAGMDGATGKSSQRRPA